MRSPDQITGGLQRIGGTNELNKIQRRNAQETKRQTERLAKLRARAQEDSGQGSIVRYLRASGAWRSQSSSSTRAEQVLAQLLSPAPIAIKLEAPPEVRRMFNQVFFDKVFVRGDRVSRAKLT